MTTACGQVLTLAWSQQPVSVAFNADQSQFIRQSWRLEFDGFFPEDGIPDPEDVHSLVFQRGVTL